MTVLHLWKQEDFKKRETLLFGGVSPNISIKRHYVFLTIEREDV